MRELIGGRCARPRVGRMSPGALMAVGWLMLACGGRSDRDSSTGEAGSSGAFGGGSSFGGTPFAGAGTGGSAIGGRSGAGGSSGGSEVACPSADAPPSPLRRLSRFELENTFRDLLGVTARAELLPAQGRDPAAQTLPVTPLEVEVYHRIAHDVALELSEDAAFLKSFEGCDREDAAGCRSELLEALLPLVLRRPLTAEDASAFEAVFEMGQTSSGGVPGGVRAVLEVALQAPEFLYRVEFGEPSSGRPRRRPAPYEMASRLSYLLWGSLPDGSLFEAAASGELREASVVEAHARRMLADPRARATVRDFYARLLDLEDLKDISLDATRYPAFNASIAQAMLQETELFIDDVTWASGGTFEALLTAPFTWVNGPLAAFYGISGPPGATFERVMVDPAQRSGLLTQGSFLTRERGPVMRGLRVATRFLCEELLPPPPEVPSIVPGGPTTPSTTRQRHEQHSSDPGCRDCHVLIDPVGFAFEHFDATGVWREREDGLVIDATGTFPASDPPLSFDGAVELSAQLAMHPRARACYSTQWLTRTVGRALTSADDCSRAVLQEGFERSGGNIPELLVALTQTEAFLFRGEGQP